MDNRNVRFTPRTLFGVLLLAAWVVLTILWVTSTIHSVIHGQISPLITAIAALALMALLAGMEGLEVSVIDRWRSMYPDRSQSQLAAWLAARQFFVAIIVTTATLLADRKIVIPGSARRSTVSWPRRSSTSRGPGSRSCGSRRSSRSTSRRQ